MLADNLAVSELGPILCISNEAAYVVPTVGELITSEAVGLALNRAHLDHHVFLRIPEHLNHRHWSLPGDSEYGLSVDRQA